MNDYKSENFALGDLVQIKGQYPIMTVVRTFKDENFGPMLEAVWINSNTQMSICTMPEKVFQYYHPELDEGLN